MENNYQFQSFDLLLGDLDLNDSETEALCSILNALFSECSNEEVEEINSLIKEIESIFRTKPLQEKVKQSSQTSSVHNEEIKFKHIIQACNDLQDSKSNTLYDGLNVIKKIIENHPKFFDILQKMILEKII